MIAKKVELLAPAGNYKALIGAINAGADAVYLGGDKFGARAYADNFSAEEIIKALNFTHVCGKKIYLTLNTLVKESEFSLIYDFVSPLYEAGLDGIIIQDLGVWSYIRETFPDIALHASTQMTITGPMGAMFLKEAGASRIVPARELSLEEIKTIKEKTGLEIECFIHGAMCYSYSGQCLFSSILGGRSGNRGRCAQPCRLPYRVYDEKYGTESEEFYPLSMKDMCTLEYIPQLIEAGIDSFKIEGRMKKPEYAAGVTAIYRKYIDLYYSDAKAPYHVDKADMDRLFGLYIRSDVQTGYYDRYNGPEMITMEKGGYLGSDEALLNEISDKYLKEEKKYPVNIYAVFKEGEPAALTVESADGAKDEAVDRAARITCRGETVQAAQNRPMTEADFLKQLNRLGNTLFKAEHIEIEEDKNVFVPVGELNKLRREAVNAFEEKLIRANGFSYRQKAVRRHDRDNIVLSKSSPNLPRRPEIHVSVRTMEQLKTVLRHECERIYIDSDLYVDMTDLVSQYMRLNDSVDYYLALPYIIRHKDYAYLDNVENLSNPQIKGFLIRNIEELYWFEGINEKAGADRYAAVMDCGMYCFNSVAFEFYHKYADEFYLPLELNHKECRQLISELSYSEGFRLSLSVYGLIPMMLSANCVRKTAGNCIGDRMGNRKTYGQINGKENDLSGGIYLMDRYKSKFPVLRNCRHCYNIIYNSVAYSLHKEWENIYRSGLYAVRCDFIFEKGRRIDEILNFYSGKSDNLHIDEYTAGHYKRGVE